MRDLKTILGLTHEYDDSIRAAVATYMPSGWNWMLTKAQLIQESLLDPKAVSPVGAAGLAQFMPDTWNRDVMKGMKLPADASPFDPKFAIPACCWYMRKLIQAWWMDRPAADRFSLALASYNAGFGNLIEAQKKAGGARDYTSIIRKLPFVTGNHNALETSNYVGDIRWIYEQLRGPVDFDNVAAGSASTAS
jgi:membrane-bound lytic murein transglycosylase F